MMTSVLQYPFITGSVFTANCLSSGVTSTPVYNWILFGKLPENGFAVPGYAPVVTSATGKNRYLSDVVTAAIPPSTMTVDLAVGGTMIVSISGSVNATSSDSAVATATIATNTVTITGVAAGTTTVVISDRFNNTVSTITVTVA
jgi:hypothetical protein